MILIDNELMRVGVFCVDTSKGKMLIQKLTLQK